MVQAIDELKQTIAIARRKGIEVHEGIPYTPDELQAVEQQLGVRLPGDCRLMALEVGALSFRKEGNHYFSYGKPSPAMIAAGIPCDLLENGRQFQEARLPFDEETKPVAVAPVCAKLDEAFGHFEFTLADADGAYRTYFAHGEISQPRMLLDVIGIFPFFAMMYDDDGRRLTSAELNARMGIGRVPSR